MLYGAFDLIMYKALTARLDADGLYVRPGVGNTDLFGTVVSLILDAGCGNPAVWEAEYAS
jgi:hypothetical protein